MRLTATIFTKVTICIIFVSSSMAYAQESLALLDLNKPELKKVSNFYSEGKKNEALQALWEYYVNRQNIHLLDEEFVCNHIYESQKISADNAIEHKFTVLSSYGELFYGDDINWEYWPVKSLELRWQLHRMYWWNSLGKAYNFYQDEKYAEEWVAEYIDWIRKNPLVKYDSKKATNWETAENQYFAWRPLETGIRLQSQLENFVQMRKAKCFTPEFLDIFLVNYHRHMEHLHKNYTESGNHRITEAQGMLYACVFFPEFMDAELYRDEAITILNEEIDKQVYDDGMQMELSPNYHFYAISTFFDVVRFCSLNNVKNVFPESYLGKIHKMVDIARRFIYPDYTMSLFSDTKQFSKGEIINFLSTWSEIYPITEKTILSKSYPESGFYFLCNGWDMNSTIMPIKAGPPAYYHCQPDNGTFEYWRKGRNFFPDSGYYSYSGDDTINAQRDWFRQTRVHNTLTLNGNNIEETNSKLLIFKKLPRKTILKIQNHSYTNLLHERQITFWEDGRVEIIDVASGKAEGEVQLNYNLSEGDWSLDNNSLISNYADGNNISVTVTTKPMIVKKEEGRISRQSGSYSDRPAYSFNIKKAKTENIVFITIIKPL